MRTTTLAVALLSAIVATASFAQPLSPRAVDNLPATTPTVTAAYGADPLQVGDLRLPRGKGPFPVAIVIHGGCWTKGFATMRNTAAMASELAAKGIATWNIEYRQLGDPGAGWPGTFLDWGAATDYLRTLAKEYPLDLSRVVVTGHSAGAPAALFVAARPKLPADSEIRGRDPLKVSAAVAIDGPGDLAGFVELAAEICRRPVIEGLMGGNPDEVPGRFAHGSPAALLPLGVRQAVVSSSPVLPPQMAEAYRAAAGAAGDEVDMLVIAEGGHFEPIAPGTSEWRAVEALILRLAGVATP